MDKESTPNTIVFCKPSSPLVCVGYHQEVYEKVNVAYCLSKGYPIVRRIVGGGVVYLDQNQLFYQVIARKSDPRVPSSITALFERFLAAPVKTYNRLGIPATHYAVNDIEVNGRKIGGSGAGDVGEARIVVGDIIFDFNYDEMTSILKAPSMRFKEEFSKALTEYLTTVKKELGFIPSEEEVKKLLKEGFEETLGVRLIEGALSGFEVNLVREVEELYKSPDWLHRAKRHGKSIVKRNSVKISGRVRMGEALYRRPKGLIRVFVKVVDGKISSLTITGSLVPRVYLDALKNRLEGVQFSEAAIIQRINDFYEDHEIPLKEVTPEDLAYIIVKAAGEGD